MVSVHRTKINHPPRDPIGVVPGSYLNEDGVRCCEYCIVGDHGRCWRAVCRCEHQGWTRDVNAQGPHGMASLAGELGVYVDNPDGKRRKGQPKQQKVKGKKDHAHYNLPRLP